MDAIGTGIAAATAAAARLGNASAPSATLVSIAGATLYAATAVVVVAVGGGLREAWPSRGAATLLVGGTCLSMGLAQHYRTAAGAMLTSLILGALVGGLLRLADRRGLLAGRAWIAVAAAAVGAAILRLV